ncbi:hydroxyethylthiazole kinase/thiamine-phosphate diphosphorylase [Lachnospiraceae bacterium PM6-15]|uniref:hydroxyethylthiazole kinase n=1 Tax=Ohessyouella blattaphilus TaxID=2949333 RepID=UPI003E22C31F
MDGTILQRVKVASPLIHCLSGSVTTLFLADSLLAIGARPIMACDPREVGEITKTAAALLINLGTITGESQESMRIAVGKAKEEQIPYVLDCVGVGCSTLRREFVQELIKLYPPAVLKGNRGEIMALLDKDHRTSGIDSTTELALSPRDIAASTRKLASLIRGVVLATGEVDVISDGKSEYYYSGGTPMLGRICGTGCVLGGIIAALLPFTDSYRAARIGTRLLGRAGERSLTTEEGVRPHREALLSALTRETSEKAFDLKLYLVTNSDKLSEEEFLSQVEGALKGGVTFCQLREKDKTDEEVLALGKKIKELTDFYGVPLVIDDRIQVAKALDCAGVHLGAMDDDLEEARKVLGPGKIIGATAKTVAVALAAKAKGADYLGVGAIYPTKTKVITKRTEVATLNAISLEAKLPIVAIGGLKEGNLEILKGSRAQGIAVVSELMEADDPGAKAGRLVKKVTDLLR